MLNLIFCVYVSCLFVLFSQKLPSWCVVVVVMSLLALLLNFSDYIKDKGKDKETIIVSNLQWLLRWFDSLKMQSMDRDLARFLQFISVFHQRNTIILNVMICLRRASTIVIRMYVRTKMLWEFHVIARLSCFCLLAWFVLILNWSIVKQQLTLCEYMMCVQYTVHRFLTALFSEQKQKRILIEILWKEQWTNTQKYIRCIYPNE